MNELVSVPFASVSKLDILKGYYAHTIDLSGTLNHVRLNG